MKSMGPFGGPTHSVVAVTSYLALALTLLSSPTSWDWQKSVLMGNENATCEGGRKGQGTHMWWHLSGPPSLLKQWLRDKISKRF